jgi:predicted MFS family arabinose efflux permease
MSSQAAAGQPAASRRGTGYQIGLTALLSLNFGFVLFDRNATNFLMPFIQPELGLSNTQVGLLSSGLSLTWALAAFGIGVLSDRAGSRKRLLILATLAFSLCSFGSGLATGFALLLMTRMLMGAAEGGIMPISQSLIAADVDAKHRGLAMGISQGFASSLMGSFVAPVLLVAFADAFGWRSSFFLAGAPGLLLALLMAWFIREPDASPVTSVAGAVPATPVRAARGGVDLASYRTVLKERNVWLCAILSTLLVAYLVVTWTFMPLFLTDVRGYDEMTMSWLMGTLGIAATVASFAIPGLSDRIGRRGLMITVPLIAVILPLAAMYFTGPVWMLGAIFVVGWLFTGTMPLVMSTVPAESVDARHMAGALGVCMGAGELIGGVIAPTLAGYAADLTSLNAPLWILAGLALGAGLVAMGIRETAPRFAGETRIGG